MKINEVITEAEQPWYKRSGFGQGVLSGLTGLDFRDENKVELAIDKIPEDQFQKLFHMTRQQFLDMSENEQAIILQQVQQNMGQQATLKTRPVQQPQQQVKAQQPARSAPAQTTVPPAPKGYINTLDVAGRKFYLDNRGDWYEYLGQMWPRDITVAQKVTDVDQLVPYIQAGKVKQEPYGTKKKK